MINVLHITAHLGLGVGKALSGLVLNTDPEKTGVSHKILCLEKPEKALFIDRILSAGYEVIVCPDAEETARQIASSDIIQLEWWNHPTTISFLCKNQLPDMRLLVWCHISGLHTSIIPDKLITSSHRFIFTSPCSYKADAVMALMPEYADRFGSVHSCGGFDGFPEPYTKADRGVSAGYIGSLNFAKLHPLYVDFLKAVPDPEFKVRMVGDTINKDILEQQSNEVGRNGMLDFCGYTQDVVSELSKLNTLVYLLNPTHYGTTENALLEAMAMGIVPIVLDNPAENNIVEHMKNGMIVRNPTEFAEAIQWLSNNPDERQNMGKRAASSVRDRFHISRMVDGFDSLYKRIIKLDKRCITFKEIFGNDPADWFLCCQEYPAVFTEGMQIKDQLAVYGYFEKTKGSVFHFQHNFPDDQRLRKWAEKMKSLQ